MRSGGREAPPPATMVNGLMDLIFCHELGGLPPPLRGRVGEGGEIRRSACRDPPPDRLRYRSLVDLPRKGGGERSKWRGPRRYRPQGPPGREPPRLAPDHGPDAGTLPDRRGAAPA